MIVASKKLSTGTNLRAQKMQNIPHSFQSVRFNQYGHNTQILIGSFRFPFIFLSLLASDRLVHIHDFIVSPSNGQQTYNQHRTHKHQACSDEYYVRYVVYSQRACELSRNCETQFVMLNFRKKWWSIGRNLGSAHQRRLRRAIEWWAWQKESHSRGLKHAIPG
jgi:uncharacterized paraquat-inducible protein A